VQTVPQARAMTLSLWSASACTHTFTHACYWYSPRPSLYLLLTPTRTGAMKVRRVRTRHPEPHWRTAYAWMHEHYGIVHALGHQVFTCILPAAFPAHTALPAPQLYLHIHLYLRLSRGRWSCRSCTAVDGVYDLATDVREWAGRGVLA
jgi:hypothetical protein